MKRGTKFARNGGGTISPAFGCVRHRGTDSPASTLLSVPTPCRSLGAGGFTLLELLAAVTITLMLAGLMLTVVTNTLNLWHRTQDNFSNSAEAKLALDMVERDLQATVFRKDDGTWFAVDDINAASALTVHGWLTPAAPIKPATTESGLVVQVPLFVQIGDTIRVDTRTGEYQTRV